MNNVWSLLQKKCQGPWKRYAIETCALVLNYIIVPLLKPADVNYRTYSAVLLFRTAVI